MANYKSYLDKDFLGYWDFPVPRKVKIIKAYSKEAYNPSSNDKKNVLVIELEGYEKTMIVNATNGERITNYVQIEKNIQKKEAENVNNWGGVEIILFSSLTRSQGAKIVDCIRVMTEQDKEKYKTLEKLKKIGKTNKEILNYSKMSLTRIETILKNLK